MARLDFEPKRVHDVVSNDTYPLVAKTKPEKDAGLQQLVHQTQAMIDSS
jgi:hypothetical protein